MEKTASFGDWRNGGNLARLVLGLIAGWLLIQLINRSWLTALLLILTLVILLLDLNGYRAWVLLMAATLVSGFKYSVTGLNMRPDQIMVIFLVIGWLPALLVGKAKLNKVPLLLPVMLYVAVNFISSALYSPDKAQSYQGSFLLLLYVMMYVMTVTVLQDYPDKMKSVVKVLLVLGIVQAAYAVVALLGNKAGINLGGVSTGHVASAISLQGGFEEPNLLGAFSAAIGIMFLAFLTSKQKEISAFKLSLGAGLMMIVLLLTFTRAAWLGFIIGTVLLVFLQKPPRNIFNPRAAAMAVTILAALVLVALPFTNAVEKGQVSQRLDNLLNFSGGSGLGRVKVQKQAIQKWQDAHMLGSGTLSMQSTDPYSKTQAQWLYSSVIQALHDTGIIGLGLLLWFQVGVVVIAARASKKTRNPFYRAALAGFVASNIVLLISSQASSFLWLGFPWIFAGLTVAVARVASAEGDQAKALSRTS
ncbi:MAG: O-antigen ligase family protein [Thermoleophilia bacterium]